MTKKRLRIFLGLTEIAGYYRGLKAGFRAIGANVTFVNLSEHPFDYGGGDAGALVRLARFATHKRIAPRNGRCTRMFWSFVNAAARCILLARAIIRCDVFIFACGSSFLRYRDLAILKFFGKTIIYQFHGSDSRPPYIDGSAFSPDEPIDANAMIAAAAAQKRKILAIEKYADVIVNIPPQGHFHERRFVNWIRVGLPNRPPVDHLATSGTCKKIQLLHCPSHPAAKGTPLIRQAVERLRSEGLDVELIELTNQPNEKVLRALARCDVVIDQAYADYPLPGLAVEAAWFARPVVIAGYATGLWRELLPGDLLPPSRYCRPDELTNTIRRLVTDSDFRRDAGRKLRKFVETHWSPAAIAARYLRMAAGDIPDEWMCDPNDIDYLAGCGLSEEAARRRVRSVIESGGVEALQLSDKPKLERLFEVFASAAQTSSEL